MTYIRTTNKRHKAAMLRQAQAKHMARTTLLQGSHMISPDRLKASSLREPDAGVST